MAQFTSQPSARLAQAYQMHTIVPRRPRTNTARLTVTLHEAACDNNYKAVKDILQNSSPDINAPDGHGFAPIHYAAKFNCFRILKLLTERGADPSVKTRDENLTPLHLAAHYRPRYYCENIQSSISARSSIVNEERHSSSEKAVRLLVNHPNVDVNATNNFCDTPLHMACQRGNFDAVEILIESEHIDLTPRDRNEKNTPLHEACKHGHSSVMEIILDKLKETRMESKDWLLTNKGKQTLLHLACREGHGRIVKVLLDKIPEECKTKLLQAKDNEDNTALDIACQKGSKEVVNHLLENGVFLYTTSGPKNVTPLHIAASHGHNHVVIKLLEKDIDLAMEVDTNRQTPVHYAVLANDREVLETFNESLDGNIAKDLMTSPDKQSRTPLLLAAMLGKDAAFQMLLEILPQDAHDSLDRDGKSVLCLAAEGDHIPILKSFKRSPVYFNLLNTSDADINTPLHLAAKNGNVDTVKYLLSLKDGTGKFLVNRNPRNVIYQTPMHQAAKNGHAKVVSELKFSSLCMEEDDNGDTPLHLACTSGHYGVAQVLRRHSVDAGAKNYRDHTPLHCAAVAGHDKLVKSLITDFHAEVDPTDKNNATPLHLAAHAGHLKVVNSLLEHNADVSKKVDLDGMKSFNALDLAIDGGHEKVAMAIIKSSQWQEALRNKTKSPDSVWGETTPLRKLIRNMPRVAELVFENCTTPNHSRIDSKEYQVKFNYEFVEDFKDPKARSDEKGIRSHWGPARYSKANHPLTLMVEYGRTNLLTHPLVTSLLRLKWNRYGALIYGLHLFIYSIFVLFLTTFALILPNPESETCQAIIGDNRTFGTENCSDQTLECGVCMEPNMVESIFLRIAGFIIMLLSVFGFCFYIYLHARLYKTYLKDFATAFNFILAILAFIFAVVLPSQCYCPRNWQWQLGTLAVFIAWVNFCVLFRKLPLIGIYVLMFVKVFYTFCKVIVLFLLLVIAFSLAFFMAFNIPNGTFRHSPFATPARSMVKTMTMIVGEFEYEQIFNLSSLEAKKTEDVFVPIAYDEVANLLWVIFLVLGPILFLNLLTGLAVDDIKKIQEDAAFTRLELQIVGVLGIEEIVPRKFRNRFMIVSEYSIIPNQGYRLWESFRHKLWEEEGYDTVGSISKELNHRRVNEEDHRRFQYDAMVDDIAKIKRTLRRLDGFMEQMAHRSCQTMAVPLTPSPLIHHNTFDLEFEQSLSTQQPKSGTAEDFFSDPNL